MPDLRAEEEEILSLSRQLLELTRQKDAAGVAKMYSADGRLLVPTYQPMQGHDKIAELWKKMFEIPEVSYAFQPIAIEVAASGDLAYEYGSFTLRFVRSGSRFEDSGPYVMVWKKIAGEWKLALSILNSSLEREEHLTV